MLVNQHFRYIPKCSKSKIRSLLKETLNFIGFQNYFKYIFINKSDKFKESYNVR